MTDFDDAQFELGRELVAAGYRRQTNKHPWRPTTGLFRIAAPIMAGLVLIASFVGVSLIREPGPASAQVFKITELADGIELSVIDIITTPEAVEQQLVNDLGLLSELHASPVHPYLVGKIIAVGTTGDSGPVYDIQPDGTIDTITLNEGFNGTLIISYGRAAEDGELYHATIEDPRCIQLWGQTINQTRLLLEQNGDTVRYETVDADLKVQTDANPENIDPAYGLTSISYITNDTLVVSYSANPGTQPDCR